MVDVVPAWYRPLCGFGVTGTNGKTSTSLFLDAILASAGPTAAVTTVGLYADHVRLPDPLSAENMDRALRGLAQRGGRRCVLELSSEALALGILRKYPVRYGTFTNLSHDHLDAHHSAEHYLASKAQLFMSLPPGGVAVLNAADPTAELLAEVVPKHASVVRYAVPSRGPIPRGTEWAASHVRVGVTGTTFTLHSNPWYADGYELFTGGVGAIFAENALAALATGVAAGIAPDVAARALRSAAPPPGRFEVVAESPLVVVDYAHTPDALVRTLATARSLCRGRLCVVFGAGGERDKDKRPLMGQAARAADVVWLTSDNPRSEDPRAIATAIQSGLGGHPDVHVELDRKRAITSALARAAAADCVVIAGKGHETTQHVAGRTVAFTDRDVVREALGSGA